VSTAIVKLGKVATGIPFCLSEEEQHVATVLRAAERLAGIRGTVQKERIGLQTAEVLQREGCTRVTRFSKQTDK
jgi:hypothetical protein